MLIFRLSFSRGNSVTRLTTLAVFKQLTLSFSCSVGSQHSPQCTSIPTTCVTFTSMFSISSSGFTLPTQPTVTLLLAQNIRQRKTFTFGSSLPNITEEGNRVLHEKLGTRAMRSIRLAMRVVSSFFFPSDSWKEIDKRSEGREEANAQHSVSVDCCRDF